MCLMTKKMPYGEECLPDLKAASFPMLLFVVNLCKLAYKSAFLCCTTPTHMAGGSGMTLSTDLKIMRAEGTMVLACTCT